MVTKIAASQYLLISHYSIPHLSFPVISFTGLKIYPQKRRGLERMLASSLTFSGKHRFSLGFGELRRRSCCGLCKGRGESDGEVELEAEILDFMNRSEKPDKFPTKKELLDGGRKDLVDAIIKTGGWLSMGWESDDENEENEEFTSESGDFNIEEFQERVESLQERISFQEADVESTHSSQIASSSGRSLDMAAKDDSGILGILNRLEKERNLSLGTDLGSNGHQTNSSRHYGGDRTNSAYSTNMDKVDLGENIRLGSGSPTEKKLSNMVDKLSSNGSVRGIDDFRYSYNTDMWRTWSRERAGSKDLEFEAAEICFDEDQVEEKNDKHKQLSVTASTDEALDGRNKFHHKQIQTRLQQMEQELASTLHLLRSQSTKIDQKDHQDQESNSGDLQKLSDAWEFHENDVMNAQAKLRSIRAKLAILEGKIALSIIESQKIVEEKQRRIDCARRALQLLRTTSIVWPNSASEVLLAGSFDGWITQRKMEKSRTGIFSLTLQLYPGTYEIKFIVDGVWKCDPLRPIVHNGGYENNILIVT